MRGDVIFQIFGVHAGRDQDTYLGAFFTRADAEREIEQLRLKVIGGVDWAKSFHNKGFEIREKVVTTDFELPPLPKPRDKYFVKATAKPNPPSGWDYTHVQVFRRNLATREDERICEYERNYRMLQTFEPFRQGNREFALISRKYWKTAVLDLACGDVIAEEADPAARGGGFCPVGFYVPDWWDVHRWQKIPGSERWSADDKWPVGDFGFVWGCHWGDDSSWKVQYLDLSRIQDGVIARDERFGYVELASGTYESPCLKLEPEKGAPSAPPPFIGDATQRQ